MILEHNGIFSDNQSLVATATIVSTNVLDCGVANPNLGAGTPLWVVESIHTKFTGSGGITTTLQHCASSGGSYLTLLVGVAHSTGTGAIGDYLLAVPLPMEHLRYLRLSHAITMDSGSAGAVDAYLSPCAPFGL